MNVVSLKQQKYGIQAEIPLPKGSKNNVLKFSFHICFAKFEKWLKLQKKLNHFVVRIHKSVSHYLWL